MVNDPQAAPFTIAIIGGGLAGLTLSIGLTRFGISHKIYESAKCFSEIGAGIAMGPNAVWALALIDPQLRQCYDRCATFNHHEDQRELFFHIRYGMESDETGAAKYAAFWGWFWFHSKY
jgi:salicylate hydroxylase